MEQLIHQNKIAGLYTHRNPVPVGKDELAKNVTTESSNTFILSLAIFWAQTSTPAWILAHAQAPALASGLPDIYTNINLQKTTRLALKSFVESQKYSKANSTPWDKAFKAWNPNLYYNSFYIKDYYFC